MEQAHLRQIIRMSTTSLLLNIRPLLPSAYPLLPLLRLLNPVHSQAMRRRRRPPLKQILTWAWAAAIATSTAWVRISEPPPTPQQPLPKPETKPTGWSSSNVRHFGSRKRRRRWRQKNSSQRRRIFEPFLQIQYTVHAWLQIARRERPVHKPAPPAGTQHAPRSSHHHQGDGRGGGRRLAVPCACVVAGRSDCVSVGPSAPRPAGLVRGRLGESKRTGCMITVE